MLDSGAQLSVRPSVACKHGNRVHAVSWAGARTGFHPVEVCGGATVTIDVGDGQRVSQELQVLASDYPILILGRDFLRKFHQTELDWDNYRIRLGDSWKETKSNTR